MYSALFDNTTFLPWSDRYVIRKEHILQQPVPYSHNLMEFIYIVDGSMFLESPTATYIANRGSVVFIPANTPHITDYNEDSLTFINLMFSDKHADTRSMHHLQNLIGLSNSTMHLFEAGSSQAIFLTDIIERSLSEELEKKLYYEDSIFSYINLLQIFLHREELLVEETQAFENKYLQKLLPAIKYINEHYAERINLRDMSQMLYISENYFERLFKLATGTTFTEYLTYVRISEAKVLLLNTTEKISTISTMVGFSSHIHFNRCFKKYNLCTPQQYRAHEAVYSE